MTALPRPTDERGSSMVELLVGMAMGMIVLVGLSMVIITTLHGNARVTSRVEATQNARLAMTKIVEQMHSACYSPRIVPIKETSTPTKLVFVHSAPSEAKNVEPRAIESVIALEGETLWETENGVRRRLLDNVGPGEGSAVFTYYKFEKGQLQTTAPLSTTPNLSTRAAETVYIRIGLTAEPRMNSTRDAAADATVHDSATLRLTPPLYNTENAAAPCQ
jgi:hypothetical protein